MESQIESCLLQLTSASQDLTGIAGHLSHQQFNWRPSATAWSVGQCVEHLNITTERYIPVLQQAEANARSKSKLRPGPFALGFLERWFLKTMEPPPRRRMRTGKSFIGGPNLDPSATLHRYLTLHDGFRACIRDADGIDLKSVKVRSQFGPISWSLNATFAILLAHERRHIWQAREVRKNPAFPAT